MRKHAIIVSMDKQRLRDLLLLSLESELRTMTKAAADAREAATHDDAKPENDKDTRALEASYLAGAQAARAEELKGNIAFLKTLAIETCASAKATALIELDDGEASPRLYFLLPAGGGVKLAGEKGEEVTVLTPESPLGRALLGKKEGDSVEVVTRAGTKEYEISRLS